MIIDRSDMIINLCEMKYTQSEYILSANDERDLRQKITVFYDETKSRKTVHTVLITTFGLSKNEYSGMIQNVITLNDLFK